MSDESISNLHTKFIESILPTCLKKQEEWWSYELCFNKGLRQIRYHLDKYDVMPDGQIIQKQVNLKH